MTILAYFGFNPMQTQFIAFGSEGSEQGFLPLTKKDFNINLKSHRRHGFNVNLVRKTIL